VAGSIDELLDRVTRAMADGADLSPYLVEDVLVMGTDPDEYWEGRDAVVAALAAQDETLGRPAFASEGDRRVRSHGDIGWVAEHLGATFRDSTIRMRMTGVAVRGGDGRWRFAQLQAAPAQEPVAL
jgi:ketosteroid isomerase-like protein